MTKPRLLIPIALHFTVRYALRTGLIQRITEYAQPVVLLGWGDPDLERDFEQAGAEVHPLPRSERGRVYTQIRYLINEHNREQMRSPSTAIDDRRHALGMSRLERLRTGTDRGLRRALMRARPLGAAVTKLEERWWWRGTNGRAVARAVAALRPDALLSITPFMPDDEAVVRACAAEGLPLIASILSFDNLVTRGWLSTIFDHYCLWNRHIAAELPRIYAAAVDRPVTVTGPPQFDFYWDPSYIWDEADWRAKLGLPPDRPVILVSGVFKRLVPHEPLWLGQLDDAIERGELPGNPVILFRRHPVDPLERWRPVLQKARHVVYDDPWPGGREILAKTNIRRADIEKLASTLRHCAVHVNAASTMTVDGSIFDRPQVGPAYDDRPGRLYDGSVRELYLREHYLPITHSGGLAIAYSREELVAAIRSGLENPGERAEGRRRIVQEICTYADGRATERVNAAVRAFLAGQEPPAANP